MFPRAMNHLAHVCPSCATATIFSPDATYPRRCASCEAILRITAVADDDLFAVSVDVVDRARRASRELRRIQ
jgi:uncharacterized protein (DUF983 family)